MTLRHQITVRINIYGRYYFKVDMFQDSFLPKYNWKVLKCSFQSKDQLPITNNWTAEKRFKSNKNVLAWQYLYHCDTNVALILCKDVYQFIRGHSTSGKCYKISLLTYATSQFQVGLKKHKSATCDIPNWNAFRNYNFQQCICNIIYLIEKVQILCLHLKGTWDQTLHSIL
jgi:hypothetical protein